MNLGKVGGEELEKRYPVAFKTKRACRARIGYNVSA